MEMEQSETPVPQSIHEAILAAGYVDAKKVKMLKDGTVAIVYPFIFTDAILVFTPAALLDPWGGYHDRWCYEPGKACKALDQWDGTGEPSSWHRHPTTGRRRTNGDPLTEYTNH